MSATKKQWLIFGVLAVTVLMAVVVCIFCLIGFFLVTSSETSTQNSTQQIVDMADVSVSPTVVSISNLTLPQEINNSSWSFTINRIDFLDSIDQDGKILIPDNGIFFVSIGTLLNTTDEQKCLKGQQLTLRDGSEKYEMKKKFLDAAKDIYNLDYPGLLLGQCLGGQQVEESFLIVDIPKDATDIWLQFDETEIQIGQVAPLIIATPVAVDTLTPTPTETPASTDTPVPIEDTPTVIPAEPTNTLTATNTPEAVQVDVAASEASSDSSDEESKCTVKIKQEGRNEPEYVGVQGFLVDRPDDYYDALPSYPWSVPLLTQIGPELWEPSAETLPHKTPVVVLEQHLKHEGFGRYSGFLVVQSLDDSQEYRVDHYNFTPTDYWNCPPYQAIKYSSFIARFKGDEKPVNRDGEWEDVGEQKEVYCTGKPGIETDGFVENGVECLMYKQYRNGFGGVVHIFSSNSLEIIY